MPSGPETEWAYSTPADKESNDWQTARNILRLLKSLESAWYCDKIQDK